MFSEGGDDLHDTLDRSMMVSERTELHTDVKAADSRKRDTSRAAAAGSIIVERHSLRSDPFDGKRKGRSTDYLIAPEHAQQVLVEA